MIKMSDLGQEGPPKERIAQNPRAAACKRTGVGAGQQWGARALLTAGAHPRPKC